MNNFCGTVLIVGASRGLGLGLARHDVYTNLLRTLALGGEVSGTSVAA
jgi:hypothetical protein